MNDDMSDDPSIQRILINQNTIMLALADILRVIDPVNESLKDLADSVDTTHEYLREAMSP